MKLIFGWGIDDTFYAKKKYTNLNGKQKQVWVCPYYADWSAMLSRCYYTKIHKKQPTYVDCTVCNEWKYLSNFIKWVDSQPNKDWQNCDLDKDLLTRRNKHYCPDTCVYIPNSLNKFMTNHARARGECLLGVTRCKTSKLNPFTAECQDPYKKVRSYIGIFPTELEAHIAWQQRKHTYACILAEKQTDPRVAKALRERYAPDKDWTKD